MQWKAPNNLSSWVQRAGRAARAPGRQGLAVMLVEKSAFEQGGSTSENGLPVAQSQATGRGGRGRGRGGRGGGRGKKMGAGYGVLHGQKRGTHSGTHDTIGRLDEPVIITSDSIGEGLYQYIQTTFCRRAILTTVFGNVTPGTLQCFREIDNTTHLPTEVPQALCCDLCNPTLFNNTRPSKPVVASRQKKTKKGPPVDSMREALYTWRRSVKRDLYPQAMWAPHAILDNASCELLSSIGPIPTMDLLAAQLRTTWARWDELGESLFKMVSNLEIPPIAPTAKNKKRTAPPEDPTDLDLLISTTEASLPLPLPKRPRMSRNQTSSTVPQPPIQTPTSLPIVTSAPLIPSDLTTVQPTTCDSENNIPGQTYPTPPTSQGSSSQSTAAFPPSDYESFFAGLRR